MFDHLRIWTTWKQWEQEYRKASVADTKDLEKRGICWQSPTLITSGRGRAAKGASPVASTNKKGTFVYQKFLFCLSKPQAWCIIAARSVVYIIKGALRPCISLLITRQRVSFLWLDDNNSFGIDDSKG